jgi:4-hydroxy-tetrahydrodipicolinate synthase
MVPGINGLLVNGHAGENFVLSVDEKQRVVEIARRHAPKNCLIVSGVNHESRLEAALEAVRLEAAGADSLLVFPPNSWALPHAESCVSEHHRRIRDATRVPLMLYAAPVGAGAMAYGSMLLERLVSDHRYVAIKEGSWEVTTHEQNLRLIRKLRPDFIVLSSGDGCAAEAGDWRRAHAIHERLYPLAMAIYRDAPGGRVTARIKACLKLLGRVACDALRPPQPSASPAERRVLELALRAADCM